MRSDALTRRQFEAVLSRKVIVPGFRERFRFEFLAGLRNSRQVAFLRIFAARCRDSGWMMRLVFHSKMDIRVKYCAYRLFRKGPGVMWTEADGRSLCIPRETERVVRACCTFPELAILAQLHGFDCFSELVLLKLLNRGKLRILAAIVEWEPDTVRRNLDICELVAYILKRTPTGQRL